MVSIEQSNIAMNLILIDSNVELKKKKSSASGPTELYCCSKSRRMTMSLNKKKTLDGFAGPGDKLLLFRDGFG